MSFLDASITKQVLILEQQWKRKQLDIHEGKWFFTVMWLFCFNLLSPISFYPCPSFWQCYFHMWLEVFIFPNIRAFPKSRCYQNALTYTDLTGIFALQAQFFPKAIQPQRPELIGLSSVYRTYTVMKLEEQSFAWEAGEKGLLFTVAASCNLPFLPVCGELAHQEELWFSVPAWVFRMLPPI